MSDINQPCPTICSACKGKCSDQLVLPAGCVLRPTIERVEAVLTPERIADLFPKESCSPGLAIVAFARAISRDVVAILAEDQTNPRDGHERPRAWRDVLAERRRQISVEGWTPEHDDQHKGGGMAFAAAAYASHAHGGPNMSASLWRWTGWASHWFKPKNPRHALIRAGALILAEIERLDRATPAASGIVESGGE